MHECPVCGIRCFCDGDEYWNDAPPVCDCALSDLAELRLTLREPDAAGGVAREAPDAENAARVTLNG